MSDLCRVCGAIATAFGQAKILGKHPVQYYRCERCGFVQTEKPFWLGEAYQEALSGLDVGAVSCNLRLAPIVRNLINRFFDPSSRFVDYGGGTGLFVRLMRDAGFDFWWLDKFATNIFARGFEAGSERFELLTAFEVFEHLEQPVMGLEHMLLLPEPVIHDCPVAANTPRPGEWWYYGLEHGQHVAFYTPEALESLASRFDLNFYSADELHLFTEKRIQPSQFRFNTQPRVVRWRERFSHRPSLTSADYQRLAADLKTRHSPPPGATKD